jgi:molybdopterin molybdotransferase
VAIFATGDEVIDPGNPTKIGQVRDINSTMIAALAEGAGAAVVSGGILPDTFEVILDRTRRVLAEGASMLVITAGSSVSVRDLTPEVFSRLGLPGVLVHGIASKPGKPTILGMAGGIPLLGLPGNPVSAFVQFMMIGLPVIYRLLGTVPPRAGSLRAKLTRKVESVAGRADFVPARLVDRDGEVLAEPITFKSNLIFSLVRADGLLVIPADRDGVEAGEWAEVRMF